MWPLSTVYRSPRARSMRWIAPYEETNSRPLPEQRSRKSPSLEKKERAPPHCESTSMFMVAARKEPDCTSNVSPCSSSASMSPGSAGATVTSPACSAVKVLTKKLSPPRDRTPQPAENAAACAGIHLDAVRHTHHGAGLSLKLLTLVQPDPRKGVRWLVKDFVVHVSLPVCCRFCRLEHRGAFPTALPGCAPLF